MQDLRDNQNRKKYRYRKGRVAIVISAAFVIVVGAVYLLSVIASSLFGLLGQSNKTSSVLASGNILSSVDSFDGHIIVLDSGHSAENPGGQGLVSEEDITPIITEYLRVSLESDDNYKPILTHEYDIHANLAERRDVALEVNADFFISIHCNAFDEQYNLSGFEVFPQNPEHRFWETSYSVAGDIAQGLIEAGHIPRKDNGIFYCRYEEEEDGIITQYSLTEQEEEDFNFTGETFGVIKSEEYPGVLIEAGYVTSEYDVTNWMTDEGCKIIADVIYKAICENFGTEPII